MKITRLETIRFQIKFGKHKHLFHLTMEVGTFQATYQHELKNGYVML
jgi:hypothetical protein